MGHTLPFARPPCDPRGGKGVDAPEVFQGVLGVVHESEDLQVIFLQGDGAEDLEVYVDYVAIWQEHRVFRFIRNRNSAVISSILQGNNSLVAISYIDGYPVACLYGFVRNKTFTLLKSASTKYGVTYSAKHLIFSDLIRYSVENKVANNIDLCRTDDKFKTDFMSKKHHTYSFEIKL